jgi:hypothetical protein
MQIARNDCRLKKSGCGIASQSVVETSRGSKANLHQNVICLTKTDKGFCKINQNIITE